MPDRQRDRAPGLSGARERPQRRDLPQKLAPAARISRKNFTVCAAANRPKICGGSTTTSAWSCRVARSSEPSAGLADYPPCAPKTRKPFRAASFWRAVCWRPPNAGSPRRKFHLSGGGAGNRSAAACRNRSSFLMCLKLALLELLAERGRRRWKRFGKVARMRSPSALGR